MHSKPGAPPRGEQENHPHPDNDVLHEERYPERVERIELSGDSAASTTAIDEVEHDADKKHEHEAREKTANIDDSARGAQRAHRIERAREVESDEGSWTAHSDDDEQHNHNPQWWLAWPGKQKRPGDRHRGNDSDHNIASTQGIARSQNTEHRAAHDSGNDDKRQQKSRPSWPVAECDGEERESPQQREHRDG